MITLIHSPLFSQWVVKGNTLRQFKNLTSSEPLTSPVFEVGPNIKWRLTANHDDQENCMLSLSLVSFPEEYSEITIFHRLQCAETTSNHANICSMTSTKDVDIWFRGQMTKLDLVNLRTSTIKIKSSITILQITGSSNEMVYRHSLSLNLRDKSRFVVDWTLTGDDLQKMKTLGHSKFISMPAIADGMWLLQCAPDGYQSGLLFNRRMFCCFNLFD